MKKYLVTTADQNTWPKNLEKAIFLGDWCLPGNRSDQVLPSPWEDADKLCESDEYTRDFAQNVFDKVHDYYNKTLNIRISKKAFAFLIFPWLDICTSVIFDRYENVREALHQFPGITLRRPKRRVFDSVSDTRGFVGLIQTDEYNAKLFHAIYSQIRGAKDYKQILLDTFFGRFRQPETHDTFEGFDLKRQCEDYSLEHSSKILFYRLDHRHETHIQEIALSIEGQAIMASKDEYATPMSSDISQNMELRTPLSKLLKPENKFEEIFLELLPALFPTRYLEGLTDGFNHVMRKYSVIPELIVSNAHAWLAQDEFKFFAAMSVDLGSRIAMVQINGTYFTYRFMPHWNFERQVADHFVTWGTKSKDENISVNLPCLYTNDHVNRSVEDGNAKGDRKILYMGAGITRYMKGSWSSPLRGGQSERYFQGQLTFFDSLPQDFLTKMVFRIRTGDNDPRCFLQRIETRYPELPIEGLGVCTAADRMASNDIYAIVVDHISTPWLEALTCNKPTVLFWSPADNLVDDATQLILDEMLCAKMLHLSPQDAAKWVQMHPDELSDWWKSHEVQGLRDKILTMFFRSSETWMDEWRIGLLKMIEAGTNRAQPPKSGLEHEIV